MFIVSSDNRKKKCVTITMVKSPWIQTNPNTITAMSGTDEFLLGILFHFYFPIDSDNGSGYSYTSSGAKKLVHHKIGKKATSTELTRWLNPNQFKWMLSGASWITETQTYYLIGDDGSFCMVQMAYTNLT